MQTWRKQDDITVFQYLKGAKKSGEDFLQGHDLGQGYSNLKQSLCR